MNSSDCITQSFNIATLEWFQKCNQLIISWEKGKVLYLSPKSVWAVEVTMYVDWTCMNVNRKDVHAWMITFNGKDMYMY